MAGMVVSSPQTDGPETEGPRPAAARYQPLVIVLVAVSSGIMADRFRPMAVGWWWAIAAGTWMFWWVAWRWKWNRCAAAAILLAAAGAAASWHHCRWCLFARNDLGCYASNDTRPVCVEAVALKSARVVPAPPYDPLRAIPSNDRTPLDLEMVALRDGTEWTPVAGRARLTVYGQCAGINAGDRLRIFGELYAPKSPQNPGEFDYAEYLRAHRTRSQLRAEFPGCASILQPGRTWNLRRWVERIRGHGNRLLSQYVAPERSALAAAVLLGTREQLDPEQKQAFMETGTVHLLAVSGLHLGMLAGSLLWVLRRLPVPRHWAMLSVAALTVFYMMLTDARPPIVRATILVLVVCGSLFLGRRPLSMNSLAAAALIVLAVNPAALFQTGAQLSFLAVAGLMWLAPWWLRSTSHKDPLQRLIEQSRPWLVRFLRRMGRGLWKLTVAGAIVWLLALPLLMARFHLLTPVALVLNPILWLPMAAALISGFAALVFGSIAVPLGAWFGAGCDLALWLLQWAITQAREIPFGHCWVPGPSDWWLGGFYGGLALLAALPRYRPPRRWCLALLAAWTTVGFAAASLRHHDSRLECTFLSMGHGCAVLVELPSGQTMLYDAGSRAGSPVSATRSVAGLLWSRGITHLDAVVISHPDSDHYNAVPGLLEKFSVGKIYVSPVMWREESFSIMALREAIRRSGVPCEELCAGDRLSVGEDCRIEVLHPPKEGFSGNDNAHSVVLMIEYRQYGVLLPGDLGDPDSRGVTPGLNVVLAQEPIDCAVLLSPHHGSPRSNPPDLAEWCTPEYVVLSASRQWDYSSTEETYRAAGSQVFHTADVGAVLVKIDATGVTVHGSLWQETNEFSAQKEPAPSVGTP